MLKIIKWPDEPISSKNNSNKLASSKNNNNKLAFKRNINNSKLDRYSISNDDIEYAKKLGKLFKLRKSKSKKMFKS